MGWEVVPFAMQHVDNDSTAWDSYFVDEMEFGNDYSLLKKLALVPKVVYSHEAQKKLRKLLQVIKPNVCHAHNIYHHISPSILSVLKEKNIPTFITLHDLKLACPAYTMLSHDGICERCKNGRFFNVVKHKCIKKSRVLSSIIYIESLLHSSLNSYVKNTVKLITPSKFYIEKFVEWGFSRDHFIHIPNFVDIQSQPASSNVGNSFLYFGRLSPEKGLITMLEAAALAKASVWIVGRGPMEPKLMAVAEQLNVNVQCFGYLSGEQLYDKIRQARAIVLPSEWYENAPLSLMESYALAVPVIGAAIGGIPELIKEGETGFTFASGSSKSLAEAMKKISDLSDAQVRRMGESGRDWMLTEYTAEIYTKRLLELYSKSGINN
jgi:glycosyltransferase involved in cell wall biosynthesis